MPRIAVLLASLLCVALGAALAVEPARIGITTILSGPTADRGQSEQYRAQLALDQVNEAEQVRLPALIGALCTPVNHAIQPVVEEAKMWLPAGQRGGVGETGAGGRDQGDRARHADKDMTDLAPLVDRLKAGAPDARFGHSRLLQGV
jgi:branched-chain amino acid transport system substrate-binding protein